MLKFLLEKEFKQILRNKFLPKFIFIFPLVILLLMPLAADFEIKNINLTVIDNDHSTYSQQMVQKISASGYFRLVNFSKNTQQALKLIELDQADIILEIPQNFERSLIREKTTAVLISANTVNGTKGGLGSAFLASIINNFSTEINLKWLAINKNAANSAIKIMPQYKFNPYLRYPVFMVPALMVMVLAMICGFLPALNIVNEKEKGTIEQINVTPVKKWLFIFSKLLPYWIIGFIALSICFGVARLFYNLIPVGSLFIIYLFASIFVLGFSGFGLIISNFAKSIQQAMFMMFFFIITFILMSGLYTPVNSMPTWAQYISTFSPLKYFIQIMRAVYLKGSHFSELRQPFYALCGFAVFFNILAILSYRKKN